MNSRLTEQSSLVCCAFLSIFVEWLSCLKSCSYLFFHQMATMHEKQYFCFLILESDSQNCEGPRSCKFNHLYKISIPSLCPPTSTNHHHATTLPHPLPLHIHIHHHHTNPNHPTLPPPHHPITKITSTMEIIFKHLSGSLAKVRLCVVNNHWSGLTSQTCFRVATFSP